MPHAHPCPGPPSITWPSTAALSPRGQGRTLALSHPPARPHPEGPVPAFIPQDALGGRPAISPGFALRRGFSEPPPRMIQLKGLSQLPCDLGNHICWVPSAPLCRMCTFSPPWDHLPATASRVLTSHTLYAPETRTCILLTCNPSRPTPPYSDTFVQ